MKKTLPLLAVLALGACASAPPQNFAPLNYSYLTPITFKVATLNVVDEYTPSADEAALNANNPAPPAATLVAMLQQRMQPSGQPGSGTITVQTASITEAGGSLNGQMLVDISLTSPDGRSTASAEASVSATAPAPDSDADMRTALYEMTKRLMKNINVQLPYQIMHNIPNWVAWTNAGATPAAVAPDSIQSAPLPLPGTADSTPAVAAPPAGGSAAVPHYLPGAGPTALGPAP